MCRMHYTRVREHGDPHVVKRLAHGVSVEADPDTPCECSRCHETLPLREFYMKGAYYRTDCIYCVKRRAWESGERALHDRDRWRTRPDATLRRKYGITADEYDDMHAAQRGCCYLCGNESIDLHVDHDHTTGAVRKLLCPYCNKSLGWLEGAMSGEVARVAEYMTLGLTTPVSS